MATAAAFRNGIVLLAISYMVRRNVSLFFTLRRRASRAVSSGPRDVRHYRTHLAIAILVTVAAISGWSMHLLSAFGNSRELTVSGAFRSIAMSVPYVALARVCDHLRSEESDGPLSYTR